MRDGRCMRAFGAAGQTGWGSDPGSVWVQLLLSHALDGAGMRALLVAGPADGDPTGVHSGCQLVNTHAWRRCATQLRCDLYIAGVQHSCMQATMSRHLRLLLCQPFRAVRSYCTWPCMGVNGLSSSAQLQPAGCRSCAYVALISFRHLLLTCQAPACALDSNSSSSGLFVQSAGGRH
jgi:hypothetical protein